LHGTTSEMK